LQEEKDGLQDPQAAKLAQWQNHGNHQQSLKVSTDGAVRESISMPDSALARRNFKGQK
jgi:hypothetical protein